MTVCELIIELLKFNMNTEVMILDGFNGGGYPRTVNLGPTTWEITDAHELDCADCEERAGEVVVVLGFGCY